MITVSQIRGAAGAEYYCSGGAEGPDAVSYYLDGEAHEEPPGVWSGTGAEALGLSGEVTDHAMRSVFGEYLTPDGQRIGRAARGVEQARARLAAALAAEPGADETRREAIRAEVEGSSPTTGYDFTFSPPKSVTVLHTAKVRMENLAAAAGDQVEAARHRADRRAIEAAVMAGSRAAMDHLADHAMTRVGRHGAGVTGQWMPAPGLVVASFLQFTNRNVDPQLHVHNTTLNRVRSEDGAWRALDGRDLMRHQHAAGAVGQAVMRDQLAATLGLDSWEVRDNGAAEVAFVPEEICRLLSSRRAEIERRYAPAVAALEEAKGRALTDRELWHVRQELNLASRRGKSAAAPETIAEIAERVDALVAADGQSFELVCADFDAHQARGHSRGGEALVEWSAEAVVSEAIAACGETSATFRAPDLTAEILRRLPPVLGLSPAETKELAERLTAAARNHPDLVQVSGRRGADPGADPYGRPTDDQFAATFTLEAEQALRRLAVQRGALRLDAADVAAWLDANAPTIGADQRAAVKGIASSDAILSVLVGPAGTGKSFAMGTLAGAWSDLTDGRVIGLATSEIATNVLRDDGLDHALNIAQFLTAQERLDAGSTHAGDRAWILRTTDVVMVDEASMVSTRDLTAIRERVETAGARLVLTGDPHQLGAVEAGGVMGLLEDRAETFTLAEVRRFHESWERDASLRLRAGDREALDVYDAHGRVLGYSDPRETVTAAARAWVADHLDGRDVLAVAASNRLAGEVSRSVRDMLISLGEVDDGPGVQLGRDHNLASVGDLVQARRLDRSLGLVNREVYRVTALTGDDGLDVVSVRTGEHRHVPASYASHDLALAYASTVHAAQGRTADACHYVTDTTPEAASLYVGFTRGQVRNTAHVALTTTPENVAPGVNATVTRPGAIQALAAAFDRDPTGRAALVELEADAERQSSAAEILARTEDTTRAACQARLERHLDDLVADGTLAEADRARLCADQGTKHLARVLRAVEQSGADPREVLHDAVTCRPLTDADSVAQVLSARITGGRPLPPPAADTTTLPGDLDTPDAERLTALHDRAAKRVTELGTRAAAEPPAWALDVLGPIPTPEDPRRAEWVQRAGTIAAHREATGWTDPHRLLPPPPTGPHATERRTWHLAAWDAAGRPAHERDAALLSDGQLRIRLRAERDAHAIRPHDATPDLRAAELARERARQDAALHNREADLAHAAGDTAEAARLLEQAAQLRAEETLHSHDAEKAIREVETFTTWTEVYGPTLAEADRIRGEAQARGITLDDQPDQTTAPEWLAAERAARQADDAHRVVTEPDIHHTGDHAETVEVDPAELDALPEIPLLGSEARRAALEVDCEAFAHRAADTRSHDAAEPIGTDAQRHRRWVLDEAAAAAAVDTHSDYDAAGSD
ncbi:MAG: relaxase domain-containing protein [Actinomycetales bacterium]|nr:relaxase domain-containing protein [Actinomycetales bacterium]